MALLTRTIGATDLQVTELGFGGAPLGGLGDAIAEDDAAALVRTAYDAGIRYFDSAPLYGVGRSERRIGTGLSAVPRDEYVLSTKVGRLLDPSDGGDPTVRYDYSYTGARTSLEASLDRLGLERVDILFCHDIDVWTHGESQPGVFETAVKGILPALTDLRREGVIGAFGLGVNEWEVCNSVLDLFDVDVFLLAGRFTLLEQDALDELLPRCLERHVSVVIGGPYNSGMLATAERGRATYDYRPVDDERWQRAQAIRAICDRHNTDMRAAALQYPLRHPAVAAVIPGPRSVEEFETNLAMMDVEVPDALWSDLAAAGLARTL